MWLVKDMRGFTLIETLLYIALFGIILTGVVLSAYPLITGADRLNQRVTEEGEAAFVLHKVAAALGGEEITSISTPSETLTIWRSTGTVTFRQGDGSIEVSHGGPFSPLTASRAAFSNFSASYTASPGGNVPHTITVSFDVGGETYGRTYHVYFN